MEPKITLSEEDYKKLITEYIKTLLEVMKEKNIEASTIKLSKKHELWIDWTYKDKKTCPVLQIIGNINNIHQYTECEIYLNENFLPKEVKVHDNTSITFDHFFAGIKNFYKKPLDKLALDIKEYIINII